MILRYSQIEMLIEDIDELIHDESYNPETIMRFKEAIMFLGIGQIYAQRIDRLVSCGDSEEQFHKRLEEELEAIR